MKISLNHRSIVLFAIIMFFTSCCLPLIGTKSVDKSYDYSSKINEGQILFAPMQSKTAYLINYDGSVNHTWSSDYRPGEAVNLLEDGSILYKIKLSFAYGGAGGGIQRISWDGDLIWDFRYYTDEYLSHHDFEILPNGNILMIAWEFKTREEAIESGRDPNKLYGDTIMPDHIIEVEPTGPTSGDIVWEWHSWDHLIQDYDPSKKNYGDVEDHPELIDINFGSRQADWLHTNSIDYNEEFDQILLSIRTFSEVWVIDHSTTTLEAAGHTGGNSGKGGDILYRWGNPVAYRAGTDENQKFFQQHDARWIKPGCPGERNILVFNNGNGRPGVDYTTIDEIVPPVDEDGNYYLEPGSSYGPEEQIWIYDTDFFAFYVGGAQRLPDGNTIICNAPSGEFIEVTPEKVIVWEYENPYPNPVQNNLYTFKYFPPDESPPEEPNLDCEGNLQWNNIKPGETVTGSFLVENIGESGSLLNWEIKTESIDWGNWTFDPVFGVNLTPEDGPFTVQVSVVVPDEENSEYEGFIRVENQDNSEDFDVVPVYLTIPRDKVDNKLILNYLKQHPNIFPLIQILLKILEK
ncbi:MAG: aryl-sulfate sulfotransferase [Thermoplasmatales archaeon]|nr:MAG: aryl-sulfate sulfotransferase [Thermoplasmatales archaeon]